MSFDVNKVVDSVGGQAQIDFYLVRKKSDGSDYDFLDPSAIFTSPTYPSSPDLPIVGSPTRSANLLYSLVYIGDHKISIDDNGVPSVDQIDNYDSSEQFGDAMVKIGMPGGSSSRSRPEYALETGVKRGGALSNDKMVLAICYGQLDETSDKVEVSAVLGGIKLTSLGGHKDGEYVKPEIQVQGAKPEANITIPSACFDTNLVTPGGNQTVYRLNNMLHKFMTKGPNAV